ncbi:hypothetical protein FRC07_014286 [Ceratobasidium sp. 392]|nr:hypothetical protein FRC07_014286 [Ceratobasidium sp. 392]
MVEEDVLDLESDEWAELEQGTSGGGSSSASGSGTGSPPRKKRKVEGKKAVEIVEVLSDDEEDTDGAELTQEEEKVGPEEKVQTVLVCAMCRRPLRMGGDRLWALRCGHMIDSRCYRKLGERPIVPEEIVQLEPSPSAPTPVAAPSRGKKRGNASRGRGRGKGKGKAPVAPPAPSAPVPYVAETIEWSCPVLKCGRTHWSERVVTGATSVWQPVKDTGAVGVFSAGTRKAPVPCVRPPSLVCSLLDSHMIWPGLAYLEQNVVDASSFALPAMRGISQLLLGASAVFGATAQLAQLDSVPGLPTPDQLASLLSSGPPSRHLYPRVPLSTNDNTSIPLHDVQLLHPPPVPKSGTSCTVELLKHEFGVGSYDTPAVVSYALPRGKGCGDVGRWGGVVGNLTVYS